jgi:hypothetical protein
MLQDRVTGPGRKRSHKPNTAGIKLKSRIQQRVSRGMRMP